MSPWQALFVFEKGDDVLSKINDPDTLEYVEKIEINQFAYYRKVWVIDQGSEGVIVLFPEDY
ncbi:hypothetical protein ACQKL5_15725 [Peribacillus sp. NPDC097675]|uniref:hypothetical protein n=1 Tax=Peribacillus sp. NPDC097675 TaxID=3390618 RepID=UPI003D0070C6